MANWFPSIWKAICTTRSWKNDEKRRYFYADMGIAVCPLSNSRTFWPFELTSDRRVSPILPISTLPSPNQENIHKLRWKGIFINDVRPFLCPFCALSVPFLCPFCTLSVPFLCPFCSLSMSFLWTFYHLKSVRYVSHVLPMSTLSSPNQENIHELRWKGSIKTLNSQYLETLKWQNLTFKAIFLCQESSEFFFYLKMIG